MQFFCFIMHACPPPPPAHYMHWTFFLCQLCNGFSSASLC
jgi:hypothetical protein